jgi:hypothetical protein
MRNGFPNRFLPEFESWLYLERGNSHQFHISASH